MKNYNIKSILEENRSLDESLISSSDLQTPTRTKRYSLRRNEYSKYLKKDFDFSSDDDLQIIFDIIQKQNNQKTTQDLMILQNAFKNIKLFQELSNEIPQKQMFNLFRELLHYQYEPRQVVFNQGEIGREFYIILKGAVYIIGNEDKPEQNKSQKDIHSFNNEIEENQDNNYIQGDQTGIRISSSNNVNEDQNNKNNKELSKKLQKKSTFHLYQSNQENNNMIQLEQKPNTRRSSLFLKMHNLQRKNTNSNMNNLSNNQQSSSMFSILDDCTDEEYIKKYYPNFDILAKLEQGTSFGEVALRDQVPRTATAICSGETHFITLKRDAFRRFLEQYYCVVQQQNINFVKKIALYKNWTDQMINSMFYYLEKKTYRMNQTIYKEGISPQGIYLIRSGEVKLYQDIQLGRVNIDKHKNIHHHFMRKSELSKSFSIFQAPISHLGEGQMFGHEDIVNQTNRKSSAVCSSSTCNLFFLNKEKFLYFSKRRNTYENAFEETTMKQQWHKEIISKLESFTKNQNEYQKILEQQKQKQTQQEIEQQQYQEIQKKKSLSQLDLITRGLNRSMPSLNKICQGLDEIIPIQQQSKQQYYKPSFKNMNHTQLSEIIISDDLDINQNIKYKKIQQNFQKIISSPQLIKQSNINNNNNKMNNSELFCTSPMTQAYTPQISEKQIKSSHNNSRLSRNISQENIMVIPKKQYEQDQQKKQNQTEHSIDSIKGQSRRISTHESGGGGGIVTSSNLQIQSQSPSLMNTIFTPFKSSSQTSIQPFNSNENNHNNNKSFQKSHKRFLSYQQDKNQLFSQNNNNSSSNDSLMTQYHFQQTIRKSVGSRERFIKDFEDSLHISRKMKSNIKSTCFDQSCSNNNNNNNNNNINNTNYNEGIKIDLENQMIPVCQSIQIFKKRIENQYPQLVQQNKISNQSQIPVKQIKEKQIHERILKSLKLPKLRKSTSNLMDIFKSISSENNISFQNQLQDDTTTKSSITKNNNNVIYSQQNISTDNEVGQNQSEQITHPYQPQLQQKQEQKQSQSQQQLSSELNNQQQKKNNTKGKNSIINTLQQMILLQEQKKLASQIDSKEQQQNSNPIIRKNKDKSINLLNNNNNNNNNNNSMLKQGDNPQNGFDIKKIKIINYNFLNHLQQIQQSQQQQQQQQQNGQSKVSVNP